MSAPRAPRRRRASGAGRSGGWTVPGWQGQEPNFNLKFGVAVPLTPDRKIPKIEKIQIRNAVALGTGNRNGKLRSKNKVLAQNLPPCNIPFNSPTVASKALLYADHPIK